MTIHPPRLIVYDREIHLEGDGSIAVGDRLEVVRGNGPREGERMGTATVTAFEHDAPAFDVRLFGGAPE